MSAESARTPARPTPWSPDDGDRPTLLDRLAGWTRDKPDFVAVTMLDREGEVAGQLGFAALEVAARSLGNALRAAGACGRPVMLPAEQTPDFVVALYACLRVGAIATPVPPSLRPSAIARIDGIVADAGIAHALRTGPASDVLAARFPQLEWIDPPLRGAGTDPGSPGIDLAAPALTLDRRNAEGGKTAISHFDLQRTLAILRIGTARTESWQNNGRRARWRNAPKAASTKSLCGTVDLDPEKHIEDATGKSLTPGMDFTRLKANRTASIGPQGQIVRENLPKMERAGPHETGDWRRRRETHCGHYPLVYRAQFTIHPITVSPDVPPEKMTSEVRVR